MYALHSAQVYEEVGLDIRDTIKEDQYVEVHTSRMYVVTDVSEEWHLEPKARKEIRVGVLRDA